MALTTVDFKVTFDLTQDPKVFTIEDTTDYAGQGVLLADVTGILKITSPAGVVIYNNTNHGAPDIDPDVSLFNSIPISLPLTAGGEVQKGGYIIDYEVQDTSGVPFQVQAQKKPVYSYDPPTLNMSMVFDAATPLLSSDDVTSYVVDGVSPTTIVRDHTLDYPPSTGEPALNGDVKLISTSTVFAINSGTLQYSATLVSTITYDFALHSVLDAPEVSEYIDIAFDSSLCDIYCGLREQWDRYINNKGTLEGQKELEKMVTMLGIAGLAKQAIDCSKTEDVSMYIAEIERIGNFTTECQCDDGVPVLITGLGLPNKTTVVAEGASIDVSANTVGDTTTYTVSVEQALLDQISLLEGSKPVDGVQVSVVDLGLVSGVRNYEINISLALTANTIPVVDPTGEFLVDGPLSYDGTTLSGPLAAGKVIGIGVDAYDFQGGSGLAGLLAAPGVGFGKADGAVKYFQGVIDDTGTKKITARIDNATNLLAEVTIESGKFTISDNEKNTIVGDGSKTLITSTDTVDTSTLSIDPLLSELTSKQSTIDVLTGGGFTVESSAIRLLDIKAAGEFALGLAARFGGVDSVTIGSGADTSASALSNIAIGKDAESASTASNPSIAIGEGAKVTANGAGISIGAKSGDNSGAVGGNAIMIGYQAVTGTLGIGLNSVSIGGLVETTSASVAGISIGNSISNSVSGAIVMGRGVSGASRLVPTQVDSFNLAWGVTSPQVTIGITDSFFNTGSKYMFGDTISAPSMVSAKGDVEVTDVGNGFILKSPDTTRWRIEVDNLGVVSATTV